MVTGTTGMLARDNKAPISPEEVDVQLLRAQLRMENDPIKRVVYVI